MLFFPPMPSVPILIVPAANRSQGHIVTLEITSGQTYRGRLLEGQYYPFPLQMHHSVPGFFC